MSSELFKDLLHDDEDSKHYQLISKAKSKERHSRFDLVYEDGKIQQEQYSDLHSCLFSPDGTTIILRISCSPPLICQGRNLLKLSGVIRRCQLSTFTVYRDNHHNDMPDDSDPVIESISVFQEQKK